MNRTKILMMLAALAISAPALADQSDFDKGYEAGQAACAAATTAVLCAGPSAVDTAGNILYAAGSTVGRTKAEAMLKFTPDYLSDLQIEKQVITCTNLLN